MIPRQESDHPIDKIRFGLMVAIGGEDSSETLELVKNQERIARREIDEVPKRAESRGVEFLEYSAASRTQLLAQLEEYLTWLTKAKEALESACLGQLAVRQDRTRTHRWSDVRSADPAAPYPAPHRKR